jgi:TrmH family RNA methyltransferase
VSDTPLRFDSPQIQRLRRLIGRRSARTEAGAFVVEGPMLIDEAVRAGWTVEAVYVPEGVDAHQLGIDGIARIDVHQLGPGVLQRLASTDTPQPAIAVVARPALHPDLLDRASRIVIADRVGDPGNLGTMMRSAEAAGFDALVLTPGTVDPFNTKVVRASAGALFHVPVVSTNVAVVRSAGLTVVGSSSHQGTPHTEFEWPARLAILAGNEAHGISDDEAVDVWVRIEHAGRAESLNVAMATTLLCFESVRPR